MPKKEKHQITFFESDDDVKMADPSSESDGDVKMAGSSSESDGDAKMADQQASCQDLVEQRKKLKDYNPLFFHQHKSPIFDLHEIAQGQVCRSGLNRGNGKTTLCYLLAYVYFFLWKIYLNNKLKSSGGLFCFILV